MRSSVTLLSAELCWVRPHGSFSCLLFVTVAKVKRALGGNVTHFIIAVHLNALHLVVNMAKGGVRDTCVPAQGDQQADIGNEKVSRVSAKGLLSPSQKQWKGQRPLALEEILQVVLGSGGCFQRSFGEGEVLPFFPL